MGEPARVDLQVANRSQARTPRLKLWEPVGDKGGAPMQLAPLGPGEAVSAAYRVPTTRRGVLRTGPLRAERTDPLGPAGAASGWPVRARCWWCPNEYRSRSPARAAPAGWASTCA
ncbi:MAG: hypothetical protein IPL07_12595 [Acidimicrobiaceae bacterium]|nr:hypothetical protein [Acidimicrobiaceae bacterium]